MKRVLVALDLTELDETLIRYAFFLKEQMELDQVCFVHSIKIYDVDEAIQRLLGEKDIKNLIYKNLKTKIAKVFGMEGAFTLDVLEHDSTEYNLKRWAVEHEISTIVVGFKREEFGTGGMSQKLIRIFNGSVFLVPETASFVWNRILLPSDLSAPFQKLVQKAKELTLSHPEIETQIIKSFSIPSLFFPFIDDKKAIEQTQKHIDKQFEEAKKKYSIPSEWSFKGEYQNELNVVDVIQKESKKFQADLILMAAKGASKIPTIFIGSTTNELLQSPPFQVICITK